MPIIPAFLPMTNSSGTALPAWKLVDESGIQWNPYALSTGNGEIGIIPLQLPDGAVFVELTVVNGNSGHGTVTLFQAQNKGQGLAVKIGEADLTTATSIYIISLGGAAPVDNLTYSYYLQAKGTTGSSVSIYGITLSYNSSILLPPL
jgi:hypothetical protein